MEAIKEITTQLSTNQNVDRCKLYRELNEKLTFLKHNNEFSEEIISLLVDNLEKDGESYEVLETLELLLKTKCLNVSNERVFIRKFWQKQDKLGLCVQKYVLRQLQFGQFEFSRDIQDYPLTIKMIENLLRDLQKDSKIRLLNDKVIPLMFSVAIDNSIRLNIVDLGFKMIETLKFFDLPTRDQEIFLNLHVIKYMEFINNLLLQNDTNWHKFLIFLVRFFSTKLHSSELLSLSNKMFRVTEKAFGNNNKNPDENRLKAFDCWQEIIDNFSLNFSYMCSPKKLKLLLTPLRAKISRNPLVIVKRFDTFVYLINILQDKATILLEEFLTVCFGPFTSDLDKTRVNYFRLEPTVSAKSTKVFLDILDSNSQNYLKLTKPLINEQNFPQFANCIVCSLIECCGLLDNWCTAEDFKISIHFLWNNVLGLIDKSDEITKKKSYDSLLIKIRNWLNTLNKSTVPKFLFYFLEYILKNQFFIDNLRDTHFQEIVQITLMNPTNEGMETTENFIICCLKSKDSEQFSKILLNFYNGDYNNIKAMTKFWIEFSYFSNFSQSLITFLLWPIFHSQHINFTAFCIKWKQIRKVCNFETIKLALDQMEKIANDKTSDNIIFILYNIAVPEINFSKDFAMLFLKIFSVLLNYKLSLNSTKQLSNLILLYLKECIYFEDEIIDNVCNCIDQILTIQKFYVILEQLEDFLKKSPKKVIMKLSKFLLAKMETLYLNEDCPPMTKKIMDLLELNENASNILPCSTSLLNLEKSSPKMTTTTLNKKSKKIMLFDEDSSDFVKINSEVKFDKNKLTEHQKEMLKKRRDDIPALYQDISQNSFPDSNPLFNQNNLNNQTESIKINDITNDIKEESWEIVNNTTNKTDSLKIEDVSFKTNSLNIEDVSFKTNSLNIEDVTNNTDSLKIDEFQVIEAISDSLKIVGTSLEIANQKIKNSPLKTDKKCKKIQKTDKIEKKETLKSNRIKIPLKINAKPKTTKQITKKVKTKNIIEKIESKIDEENVRKSKRIINLKTNKKLPTMKQIMKKMKNKEIVINISSQHSRLDNNCDLEEEKINVLQNILLSPKTSQTDKPPNTNEPKIRGRKKKIDKIFGVVKHNSLSRIAKENELLNMENRILNKSGNKQDETSNKEITDKKNETSNITKYKKRGRKTKEEKSVGFLKHKSLSQITRENEISSKKNGILNKSENKLDETLNKEVTDKIDLTPNITEHRKKGEKNKSTLDGTLNKSENKQDETPNKEMTDKEDKSSNKEITDKKNETPNKTEYKKKERKRKNTFDSFEKVKVASPVTDKKDERLFKNGGIPNNKEETSNKDDETLNKEEKKNKTPDKDETSNKSECKRFLKIPEEQETTSIVSPVKNNFEEKKEETVKTVPILTIRLKDIYENEFTQEKKRKSLTPNDEDLIETKRQKRRSQINATKKIGEIIKKIRKNEGETTSSDSDSFSQDKRKNSFIDKVTKNFDESREEYERQEKKRNQIDSIYIFNETNEEKTENITKKLYQRKKYESDEDYKSNMRNIRDMPYLKNEIVIGKLRPRNRRFSFDLTKSDDNEVTSKRPVRVRSKSLDINLLERNPKDNTLTLTETPILLESEMLSKDNNYSLRILSSPVTYDTPERNKELLNDTGDISPINKDTEELPPLLSPQCNRSRKLLKLANQNTSLTPVTVKKTIRNCVAMPQTNRIRKLISNCNITDVSSTESEPKSQKSDLLTFSKVVPSPLMEPKKRILKRKLDESNEPSPKRKRVNFSDPITTDHKVYIKDDEEFLYIDQQIYPNLTDCQEDIIAILANINDARYTGSLMKELQEKNIKTVGDLAKLTYSQIKMLSIKVPKVVNVIRAFDQFYNKQCNKLEVEAEIENDLRKLVEKASNNGVSCEDLQKMLCKDGNKEVIEETQSNENSLEKLKKFIADMKDDDKNEVLIEVFKYIGNELPIKDLMFANIDFQQLIAKKMFDL